MPRKRTPKAADPSMFSDHYVALLRFDVYEDDARRAAVTATVAELRGRAADPAPIDDRIDATVYGAMCSIDLRGTVPELRAHRLRRLADGLVAQLARQTFPDSITLRWSKA